MEQLEYRTRGTSSPNNKEKVYISCHPEDFPLHLEAICRDILSAQNCAVWYRQDSSIPWEDDDLALSLGQMQLFVLPVTSRYLFQESPARRQELPFAIQNHIPLLPLLLEPGLESAFNEICGEFKALEPDAPSDRSEAPFVQRLEGFLSTVLLGNTLAEKVRAAFDAYIFMSYRKTDRAYAQELMHLIHQNDFCRDIAIWYDEFLTPGENFNDAIREAMEKSSLFAMVVTPNLVREGNYVMTTEFPAAKAAGLPVLPAEMCVTDYESLSAHYVEIPRPIDPRSTAFSDSLAAHLRDIALMANDNDPRHNFFIGLAYLSGIDVEVNNEKALALITSAAEAGLPEAMETLENMYSTGKGVVRDYHIAAAWQQTLCETLAEEYKIASSEDLGNRLFTALRKLASAHQSLGNYKAAEAVYLRMLPLEEDINSRFDSDKYNWIAAWCLAEFYESIHETKSARKYLTLLETELTRVLASGPNEACQARLIGVYESMADVYMAEDDITSARNYLMKACELLEQHVAQYPQTDVAARRMQLDFSLSCACAAEGDTQAALAYLTQTIARNEALLTEEDSYVYRHNHVVYYTAMSAIYDDYGDRANAAKYAQQCYTLAKELDEEYATLQTRLDFIDCCIELSRHGNYSEDTVQYISRAMELTDAALDTYPTFEVRAAHAHTLHHYALYLKQWNRIPEALPYLQQSIMEFYQLMQEKEHLYEISFSTNLNALGDILEQFEDPNNQIKCYLLSLEAAKATAKRSETVNALRTLRDCYSNVTRYYLNVCAYTTAEAYCRELLAVEAPLLEKVNGWEDRRSHAMHQYLYATIALYQGNLPEVIRHLECSLEAQLAVAEESNLPDDWESCLVPLPILKSTVDHGHNPAPMSKYDEPEEHIHQRLAALQ